MPSSEWYDVLAMSPVSLPSDPPLVMHPQVTQGLARWQQAHLASTRFRYSGNVPHVLALYPKIPMKAWRGVQAVVKPSSIGPVVA